MSEEEKQKTKECKKFKFVVCFKKNYKNDQSK